MHVAQKAMTRQNTNVRGPTAAPAVKIHEKVRRPHGEGVTLLGEKVSEDGVHIAVFCNLFMYFCFCERGRRGKFKHTKKTLVIRESPGCKEKKQVHKS